MTPEISIIIPVFNAMPLLKRTLDAIFAQQTHFSFEVILVDDGSTDDSVAYIKSRPEPNISLIQQANAGPAAARNRGVEAAQGRYCAFLDADDYWMDGFLELTASFLDTHPECVAVNVGQKHLTVSGEGIVPRCLHDFKEPFVIDDFFAFWGQHMHVCTGSAVIRTATLQAAGGQRTDLRVTEDLEYWALLSTYGRWGFIPEVLMVSDGTDLVNDQASWLRKMTPRWNNAPSVEVWQQRIVNRLDTLPEGFLQARGKVASQLVYGQIMSGRTALAREETQRYGTHFPKNKASQIMVMASRCKFSWSLLCKYIVYKEHHRY